MNSVCFIENVADQFYNHSSGNMELGISAAIYLSNTINTIVFSTGWQSDGPFNVIKTYNHNDYYFFLAPVNELNGQ